MINFHANSVIILIMKAIGLALRINRSDGDNECEVFMDSTQLDITYYGDDIYGDEQSDFSIYFSNETFAEEMDEVIDYLYVKLGYAKYNHMGNEHRVTFEDCDGYCRSVCCDGVIDVDLGICQTCGEHSDTACTECENTCDNYMVV